MWNESIRRRKTFKDEEKMCVKISDRLGQKWFQSSYSNVCVTHIVVQPQRNDLTDHERVDSVI